MEIHVIMTLPTGIRKCLGGDHGRALVHAGRTFALTGNIALENARVESLAWNRGREVTYRCPVDDCRGTAEDVAAIKAIEDAIAANEVGNPNLLDPDEVPFHEDECMDMGCTGCRKAVVA